MLLQSFPVELADMLKMAVALHGQSIRAYI